MVNPLHDVTEHKHGKTKHTHAWGSVDHNHILRQICDRPECKEFPTHNIHHTQDKQAVYEEFEDDPYG